MSREVEFDENEKCDICKKQGAWDFMGDYICQACIDSHKAVQIDKNNIWVGTDDITMGGAV